MSKTYITIPLSTFLDSHLGRDSDNRGPHWQSREIDESIAILIDILCKTLNSPPCHVQFSDAQQVLPRPLLWDIVCWNNSAEIEFKRKARANKDAIARENERINVYNATVAIANFTGMHPDIAHITALSLVRKKNWKAIRVFDKNVKLIEE